MMKITGVKLELLSDIDHYLFIKSGKEGTWRLFWIGKQQPLCKRLRSDQIVRLFVVSGLYELVRNGYDTTVTSVRASVVVTWRNRCTRGVKVTWQRRHGLYFSTRSRYPHIFMTCTVTILSCHRNCVPCTICFHNTRNVWRCWKRSLPAEGK